MGLMGGFFKQKGGNPGDSELLLSISLTPPVQSSKLANCLKGSGSVVLVHLVTSRLKVFMKLY